MRTSIAQLIMRPLVAFGVPLIFLLGQAQAVSLDLSSAQIGEAIRYGQSSRDMPFALFIREWRAEGLPGPGQHLSGSAWVQSPFARVAHASWAAAHRDLSMTDADLTRQIEPVRGRLAFAVTLIAPPDHPPAYHVSLHQEGEVFSPSHVESRQEAPEHGMSWVYLYCLFPAAQVDLKGTAVLVVTDAAGDSLPFVFDLSRMR